MCHTFRFSNLLFAIGTFLLGIAVSSFFTDAQATNATPIDSIEVRTCIPLDESQTPDDGPGTEVYRNRKSRIQEIDQALRDLPMRHALRAEQTGRYCATAAMMEMSSLERERELMMELTETADGTKLVHREVCFED